MQAIGAPGRGETFYGVSGTIPTSYAQSVGLEGKPQIFKAVHPTSGSEMQRDCYSIVVRNVSGVTLYAGMGCVWAAGYRGRRVAGFSAETPAAAAGAVAGYVDDQIGAAGVRNGDLFNLVVKGPQNVRLSATAAEQAGIAEGDALVSVTAAASTHSTTAGRVKEADFNVATSVLANTVRYTIGHALTSTTTGLTQVWADLDLPFG